MRSDAINGLYIDGVHLTDVFHFNAAFLSSVIHVLMFISPVYASKIQFVLLLQCTGGFKQKSKQSVSC